MKRNIITIVVILMATAMLSGCMYGYPEPGEPGSPPEEPPQFEEPQNEPEPPQFEEPQNEPELPQEPPPPQNQDKSDNPNERINVEGIVLSENGDKIVIKQNDGSQYTLRLSENTEWDSNVADWQILIGNYLVVTVAQEGRTQGEVVRIMKNANAN